MHVICTSSLLHLSSGDFVKSRVPSWRAALRCILRHCGVTISTPHSSEFARLAYGAFYKVVHFWCFYEFIKSQILSLYLLNCLSTSSFILNHCSTGIWKNASVILGSNWAPLHLFISSLASLSVSAFLYGLSVVMAS